MRKFFVTGIGTDVGKTMVSAILTESLQADYWKPIQCGTEPQTDSQRVKQLISNNKSVIHPETYKLQAPMSPHAAAAIEGVEIKLEKFKLPVTSNKNTIIEGAGGLLVPLNTTHVIADLITHLQAEVILVSQFYIGSINHTMLTANELTRRNIKVAGILFNGEYAKSSAEYILSQTNYKLLGHIPLEQEITPATILRHSKNIKLNP